MNILSMLSGECMINNFMKKLVDQNVDESTHMKFVRYSKGTFPKEEIIIKVTGKNISVQTGPEYVDVLLKILADNTTDDVDAKGKIISSKDIVQTLKDYDVKVTGKRGNKYTVEKTFSAEEFRKFVHELDDMYLLLTVKSGMNIIKVKPSLPKPGDLKEKFATAKFTKDLLPNVQEEFMFEGDDIKKQANYKHTYEISEILVDEQLLATNPLQARLQAKRKGKVIREKTIDGTTERVEYDLEV
jgi:hypothetical protein